ncbi:MAG: DUF4268 domain-containing protein [bacterium]|nr:DUF4268 domain-containing protein [bacterium]MDE0235133.1 DUF4268 domain-containing protein [bacterium]
MSDSEQNIRRLSVRELWEHEALQFTPWLAEHLNLLGQEIAMDLEVVGQERQVGQFSLDILAKQADSDPEVFVAIENQLEWTDHSHLGQLLTYAAGLGAQVVIWVAPGFRQEHAKTLHCLNDWTTDEMRFYGVRIEAVQTTAAPRPEPRYSKVVYPGGWREDETLRGPAENPEKLIYRDFFEPLVVNLIRAGFSDKQPRQIWNYRDRGFASAVTEGIWYMASLEGRNDAWVTLHIRTGDKDLTKRLFDALMRDRELIESAIAARPPSEWHWRRHNPYHYSSINIRRNGSITDSPEKQAEIRAWMLDLIRKFKEEFDPRVQGIMEALQD